MTSQRTGGKACLRWATRALVATVTALASLALVVPTALATVGGSNGRIAYTSTLDANTQGRTAIFMTGRGQMTFPRANFPPDNDFLPAVSPDGKEFAFTRIDAILGDYLIEITGTNGIGLRQVVSSDAFDQIDPPGHENAQISAPAWSADGKRIAFVVRHPGHTQDDGIWAVQAADGAGLRNLVRDESADLPDWSVSGEIVYVCTFRNIGAIPAIELCVRGSNGDIRRLPIDFPGASICGGLSCGGRVGRPKWSPDGTKIIFDWSYFTVESNHSVERSDIFSMNADGSKLKRLTFSADTCPGQNSGPATTTLATHSAIRYTFPAPSPDGKSIAAIGARFISTGETNNQTHECGVSNEVSDLAAGIWIIDAASGVGAPLLLDKFAFTPDWQPTPAPLIIVIDDGHGNQLKGLKVELRTAGGQVINGFPLNTTAGSYAFDANVAPGDYVVRATLIDGNPASGVLPSFEIRYALDLSEDAAHEPAWAEWNVHLEPDAQTEITRSFADTPQLAKSNVDGLDARDLLDDMANIYFRTRQFVDWVKLHLTPDTGPTVVFNTFAGLDPNGGDPVAPRAAFYDPETHAIVFGFAESEYANRDGVEDPTHDDDAPINGEWHEFSHHLWYTFVDATDCPGQSHDGYKNPNTCGSLQEGFATFLPALAAQTIENTTGADYDGFQSLEANVPKAWNFRLSANGVRLFGEDFAVATLLWDLVDGNEDFENTAVVGADGAHHSVVLRDTVAMALTQLWSALTTAHPVTVYDLRQALGTPPLAIDLDGDGINDIATIDQVFLMHGFFPVDGDQTIIPGLHPTYHYDVAAAQRANIAVLRNANVGLSSHSEFNAAGLKIAELIPRKKMPVAEGANVEINIRDTHGRTLSGARLGVAIRYPGLTHDSGRRLGNGAGALVRLELPSYFDFLLPSDAPLPPCDPAHDVNVTVALTTTINGFASPDAHAFDNCAYWHAIDAATGPAALSFTFTFPADDAPPITSFVATPSEPLINGATTGFWTVELGCDDPIQGGIALGCDHSEYRLDGGPVTLYANPIVVAGVGVRTLEFRSVDAIGNEEAFHSIELRIVPPPPPPQIPPPGARLYVASGAKVSLIDTTTLTVVGAPIAIAGSANALAVDPTGTAVYAPDQGSGHVSVIDTATNTLAGAPIAVAAGGAFGIAVDPTGARAYVTNIFFSNVSVIDLASRAVIGTPIAVGTTPFGIAINPAGTKVYVANFNSRNVQVIDTATNTVVGAPIEVGNAPFGIAFNPAGTRAYVTKADGRIVTVIDTATDTVVEPPIEVGLGPAGIAVNRAGTRIYVTNQGDNTVSAIDATTHAAIGAPIPVGMSPAGIVVSPDGTRVYVANVNSASVSVIVTATNTVIGSIPVEPGPFALAEFVEPEALLHTLAVGRSGAGNGTVTSAAAGIDCGTECGASLPPSMEVTLTPVPNAGSVFAGWSGACTGTGACIVTMDAERTVFATFNLNPVAPPALVGVASRKVHGAAGTFDHTLTGTPTSPTVEPRTGGAGGNHTIVFTFDKPVTGSSLPSITEGTATLGSVTYSGNEMQVPLSGVANQQYVTIAVNNIAAADGGSGGSASVRVGFLLGDVNQNRVVTVADVGAVNAQVAQVVNASNFLKDVNASGTLTVADKGIANMQVTKALPAP